jgi:hypothetical protein
MKATYFTRHLVAAVALFLVQLPATASACSVCMGDPASKNAGAANGAIFLLLGCAAAMLSGVGAFAFCLMKRANTPIPPHVEMAEMMSREEDNQ